VSERTRAQESGSDSQSCEAEARRQKRQQNVAALRAQREADTDFVRPARNRVGHHAIYAHCGDDQCESGEQAQ
jgi:hypothetical protein